MKYLLLALLLFVPSAVQAVWFDSSWDYRVPVQVVRTQVGSSSAITNFPVYVNLANMPAGFWSNVKSNGGDIRVVESDEITETPFELVSISTTTSSGELHFLADSLATTSTSTFYVYYGNAAANGYANNATYGRNNVWVSFRAVYHMSSTSDSTGNYDLTNTGGVTFPTGLLGNAASMTASSQYLGRADNLGTNATNTLSISMWGKLASDNTVDRDLFHIEWNGASGGLVRGVYEYNGGSRRMRWYRNNGASNTFLDSSGNIGDNAWRHYAYTYNGSASGNMRLRINAGNAITGTNTGVGTNGNSNQFNIGSTVQYSFTRPWTGLIDEVRVAPSTLSDAWITTEYNNLSSSTAFILLGAPESDAQPEATTTPATIIQGGVFSGGTIIR